MTPTAAAERHAALPIRIHGQGDLPIYVQIKHQLSYLITTHQIPGGTRLPTVRALAADLAINQNTVNQAYRELQVEGLIESFAGRGSFVRRFDDATVAVQTRMAQLTEILRTARRRALALGFRDVEIAQHMASLAGHEEPRCHVLFVDRAAHIAAKYADRLGHHLGSRVVAHGITLDAFATPDEATLRALDDAHFVIAFARHVPQIERLIEAAGGGQETLTITSRVVPETMRTLAGLAATTRVVVLTEERYVHAALNLLMAASQVDPSLVPVFMPDDLEGYRRAAQEADLALYTFGAREALDGLDLALPTLELVFDVDPESIEKLRKVLGVEAAR